MFDVLARHRNAAGLMVEDRRAGPTAERRVRSMAARGITRRDTGRSSGLRARRIPAGTAFSGYPVAVIRIRPVSRSGWPGARFHAMVPPRESGPPRSGTPPVPPGSPPLVAAYVGTR
ncbi:hypothetical protein [Streptomyces sp. DSM 15324]|uniref:hypothetical protein n=1 Tax=Streptomyces sp. DSM 15324 TaxID=1739111 RepID=UPI003B633FDB